LHRPKVRIYDHFGAASRLLAITGSRGRLVANAERERESESARTEGSVELAIERFRQGDASGLNLLMARPEQYQRLLGIARARLERKAPHLKSVIDAEDVVGSTMGSFLRGAKAGKFPHLQHQNELLGLLVTILVRTVAHKIRDLTRQSRNQKG
jgi:hypothetical protein